MTEANTVENKIEEDKEGKKKEEQKDGEAE